MDIKRIEDKLDKVIDTQAEMNATLAAQKVSLDEHIRRTEILENQVKPIEKHVNMIQGGLKLLVLIGLVAGVIETLHRLLQ